MTNEIAVPKYEYVSKAGNTTEIIGVILAVGSAAIGVLMLFTNGNPIALIGVLLGVLLMIAGNTKALATMALATYTMQCIDSGRMTERQVRTEQ